MTTGRIFRPFRVGRFTMIPEGDLPPDGCDIPLVLGRKGAFGSGEHETTAACLGQLASCSLEGATVLDLGSGTGILAVAALLLGAKSALAVDIEWPAAVSCSRNFRLNSLERRGVTVCGELACISSPGFDLVMANIYADILMPLADRLVELTRPGGRVLLSGIPLQDKFDIWRRYTALGCREIDCCIGEDFVTYLLEKR
ncbi:MAG TPA: 50S ribosomal protein L11 methyltransferase [Geobacteraceae bacterium]|nr:50S ribosomal protein L11 methyltransferase [Geobacteraceae bacterium]